MAILLVLALGAAALLAAVAQVSDLYQRAQAEGVLRDYAALAANRYAQRVGQDLYFYGLSPVLAAITREPAPPVPARLAGALTPPAADLARGARYTFRLDLVTLRLTLRGAEPAAAQRQWLVDTLVAHARGIYGQNWPVATLVGGPVDSPIVVAYSLVRDPRGGARVAAGIVTDRRGLAHSFTAALVRQPLLPVVLTGGTPLDSVGSITVAAAGGRALFRTEPQYASAFSGTDSLGAYLGNLIVRVALRPDVARHLVLGGLPKSRTPLLLGLLGLTAALIGAVLLLLRREYQLARVRADFVAGVSHELRTPLAQIRMFSETLLLRRVRTSEEERRSLEIIDQEARRLTHLVENLLHFARSERRATRAIVEPTDVAALAAAVVEGFAPLAAARGMTVRAEAAGPVVVPADPDAVRQILLNLLDNAAKYGPSGQTITVRAARADTRVCITVDDQGPGVPPAERDRVWEPFERLDRDRGSAVGGSGIGLAVVRELAALHGGRAWVADAPGGGARFVIELP